jgi:hypothetical protein
MTTRSPPFPVSGSDVNGFIISQLISNSRNGEEKKTSQQGSATITAT